MLDSMVKLRALFADEKKMRTKASHKENTIDVT